MAPRKGSRRRPYTQPEIDRILALYASGMPSEEVAAAVGRSSGGVRLLLRRAGVWRPAGHHLRKYHPREDAFDAAESDEAAAYWAGFLLADGGIHDTDPKRQPAISLELKVGDRGHVVAFAAFLGLPESCVRVSQYGRAAHMVIRSARLVAALARYGVVPRKSLTAEPAILTDNRHFFRGLVDGDGCLHFQTVRRKYETGLRAGLHLVGSEKVIAAFRDFVARLRPACRVVPRKAANYWTWATLGSHAVAVVRHLYEDSSVALPRKKARALEILSAGESGYVATGCDHPGLRTRPRGTL